jgi:hypothetical protein
MKKFNAIVLKTTVICLIYSFTPNSAEAIPAFARKYQISCNTCHLAVPKLKAFGEEFAGNGFVLPEGEEPVRSTIDTGDESLLLMRDLPLAVRFDAFVKIQDMGNTKSDFETPYGIKILSGGRISQKVSYYFYFYMDERGEVAGVEDAYLHFNNLGGSDFDIIAGQFQVSDPLFKRELKLTFDDYMIYTVSADNSLINLKYDRGLVFTYGLNFGLDLSAQILNGNGISDADANKFFDMDSRKNFALRASQDFNFMRLGLFGYSGSEKMAGAENEVLYFGPDLSISGEKWELNAQALRRTDTNADFSSKNKTTVDGGFAELIIMPQGEDSKFLYTALYNKIIADGTLSDYETATINISHMAARNLRIILEYTRDLHQNKNQFVFGVVSAF